MLYIFLDESGDLGLNPSVKGTSRYFVLSALLCRHKRPIEKLVNKTRRGLGKKLRYVSELHATDLPAQACFSFCKQLAEKDVTLMAGCMDKNGRTYGRVNKHTLYNSLVASFLADCLKGYKKEGPIVILSRRETSWILTDRLIQKIRNELLAQGVSTNEILVKSPSQEKALQAADIVSWAVFQSQEFGDTRFVKALSSVIKPIWNLLNKTPGALRAFLRRPTHGELLVKLIVYKNKDMSI